MSAQTPYAVTRILILAYDHDMLAVVHVFCVNKRGNKWPLISTHMRHNTGFLNTGPWRTFMSLDAFIVKHMYAPTYV